MFIIKEGIECGLPTEYIKLYANPEFNEYQMEQIRTGLKNGLSGEQIGIFAKKEFDAEQMSQIRHGLEHKLTTEQVQQFAIPEISSVKMGFLRCLLEDGVIKDVESYSNALNRYNGLPAEQSKLLANAAGNGISITKLDVIAKGQFSVEQMEFLLSNLQKENGKKLAEKNTRNKHVSTDKDTR